MYKSRYRILVILFIPLFPVFAPLLNATVKHTVAVLPFENITKDQDLDWLSMGISETIINDITGIDEILVVERAQLNRVIKEQSFQLTGAIDGKTMVRIGKMIGADILVVGSFQKMENLLRLTARFVDVETGGIIQTAKATGKMENVFDIQDKIVERLAENLKIDVKKKELLKIRRPPTTSLEAYQHLGQAAFLQSKKDYQGATKELVKAVKMDPDFAVAKEKFKEVFWDLNKGNYWSYTQKAKASNTNIEGQTTRRAGGIGTLNGKDVFYYVQSGKATADDWITLPMQQTFFYIKEADGIYCAGQKFQSETTEVKHSYSPPFLLFPYTFKVGEYWKSAYITKVEAKISEMHLNSFDCKEEAKVLRDEEVTVPAGTFKAFVVRRDVKKVKIGSKLSTPLQAICTYWFVPGIGIVKSEISEEYEIFNNKKVTIAEEELKNYHID